MAPRKTPMPKQKQVSVLIPGTTWRRLKAAAHALETSQASIIASALEGYFATLPPKERHLMDLHLSTHDKA